MFWILVVASVNMNGTVNLMTQYPLAPEFNNKYSCEQNGQKIADQAQLELGTKNSKVFWICKSVSYEAIAKTLPQ